MIVLDAMMPEMNGVEFLQVIRSYLRWSSLPVILLTAYPQGRAHIDRAGGAKTVARSTSSPITGSKTYCMRQPAKWPETPPAIVTSVAG